tara:strand:- start:2992 stop:4317 length:1326 start_codon:yes stop_codon:yes gene_type:complete
MQIIMSHDSQAGRLQNVTPARPDTTDAFAQMMSGFFSSSDEQVPIPPDGHTAPDLPVDAPAEADDGDGGVDAADAGENELEADPSDMLPPVPQLVVLNPTALTVASFSIPSATVSGGVQLEQSIPMPMTFVAQGWEHAPRPQGAPASPKAEDTVVGAKRIQVDGKPALTAPQGQIPVQEDVLIKESSAGSMPPSQSAAQSQILAALPKGTNQPWTAGGSKIRDAPSNPDSHRTLDVAAGDQLQVDPRLARSRSPMPVAKLSRPVDAGPVVVAKSEVLASAEVDAGFGAEAALLGGGERMSVVSVTGMDARAAAPAQVASAVAQQVAVAVQKNPDGVTEMILNPEELGRVKLAMATSDGAVTLTITTERPETQDLMRRHIEVLAQELRQLGFSDVGFSFQDQGRQEQSDGSAVASGAGPAVEGEIPVVQVSAMTATSLDLRL